MERSDAITPLLYFLHILKRKMFQHEMTPITIKIPKLNESMKRGCPTINGSIKEHVDSPNFRATGMKTDKRAAEQNSEGKLI